MDLKTVEETVSKIQGRLFKNSNSFSIGMLKSHFKGSGLQFKEHQVYCHGDDVRFIDWKLLAKTSTPYIKTFEEERNVEIVITLDLSQSMLMGYRGISKLQASIHIGCLLSLLAKETQDYVQFVLLGEEEKILPLNNGRKAIIQLVSELKKMDILNDEGEVNIKKDLTKRMPQERIHRIISRFIAKRKEVVVLSDFNEFLSDKHLKDLMGRKNTHAFRMITSLDQSKKQPFMIFGKGMKNNQNSLFQIESKSSLEEITHKYGQKIKNINIEDRYLEEFVREMV